ncbi:lipid asymmetry maintenance protein MlaB [Azoarcus sp. KH32C]|uniref:STAS domain-containing protein n=1 Tax=Azoarcus sp. KH32C TaxID=748247 RepID=UPI0002386BC3|nr:STAS domain-containing protein [Azoarcus sp. KH32C]BAL25991.1 STAS domain-containing protein [Azoarcus sp. KH32C]
MSHKDTAPDAGANVRLALDADLTIYHTVPQKQALIEALAGSNRLELDLSAVGDIDTAGLQLLILVKREARVQGKEVVITGHSTAVRQVIDFCNLAAAFGDPMILPA